MKNEMELLQAKVDILIEMMETMMMFSAVPPHLLEEIQKKWASMEDRAWEARMGDDL